jgi:hypothetical protein
VHGKQLPGFSGQRWRKIKKPTGHLAGGSLGIEILASESNPNYTPAQHRSDSSTYTSRDGKSGSSIPLSVQPSFEQPT